MITKTKIQKALAVIAIAALGVTQFGSSFAADIGDTEINGTYFGDITWDDTFPGTATGTISGVVVTANIAPTITLNISTGSIDLGTLNASTFSTGTLDIEVGTNAISGVVITARSGSGGLVHTTDSNIMINSVGTDGVVEDYKFSSSKNAADDSTITGFSSTAALDSQVVDNTFEHQVYSSNKPEQLSGVDDIFFNVSAKANAQTPAGNYQDTITFTVTGNF